MCKLICGKYKYRYTEYIYIYIQYIYIYTVYIYIRYFGMTELTCVVKFH
jgi:hypothetical protein